jgi:transcriptional regulator with XRE-family HTH domain
MAAESPDPAVLRRRLQIELRKARDTTGQSQKDVADALAWSPSKLLRIENGAVGITMTDLRALLDHYGVRDRKRVDELIKIAQDSRKLSTAAYGRSVSSAAIKFYNFRSSALRVRNFETLLIPGLLQTEEYANAVIKAFANPDDSTQDLEDRVTARMDQQSLLDREGRPELYFMIDEAVLWRWMGGSGVMRNQLEHLKKLAERPRLTIQVVPFSHGAYAGLRGSFQILEFAEGEDYVLFLENARGDLISRDLENETERYLTLFWEMESVATKPWEFAAFIDRVMANLDRKSDDAAPVESTAT